MAISVLDKSNKIYQFIYDHKYALTKSISQEFKCVICKEILINACQARCGCHYCSKCMDYLISKDNCNCPGITDDCQMTNLTNIMIDYRMNKQICQLVVKCPEEMCSHECQLINMEEHWRFCSNKSVKCLFYDLGCSHEKMANDKMSEHLQIDNYNHSKILIDMINDLKNEVCQLKINAEKSNEEVGNLKNEVCQLKQNAEKSKEEVDQLKKIENENIEIIKSMSEEINLIKINKEEMKEEIVVLRLLVEKKCDEMSREIDARCNIGIIEPIYEEMRLIKMDNDKLIQEMEIGRRDLQDKMSGEIDARLCEMREQ